MDLNLFLCITVWFLSTYITSSSSQLCAGPDGKVCCIGYVWNEAQNTCIQCMTGFYGINCTIPCPYPGFGWDCQLQCTCSNEDCNHVYGWKRKVSEDTTEAAPKSTNISHQDKMCAEETGDVYESNSTSLIAGIISLLIVAGLLLVLYAIAYLHKVTRIVQGDTASKSTF
ncbi:multiple epidermal growth factor-like domains protein 10 isoform X2 [Ostrea edulis]|uniref:multiple epidermal growth factor-like domains protein 10 isoform X2 n=1 Tax=Ostrea edulis TaxID=37623 RepID=UPI0024AFBC8F|nr:multiple epidermal growth factor-like domains protein 10 isoform X2 [Ostrea edulis]